MTSRVCAALACVAIVGSGCHHPDAFLISADSPFLTLTTGATSIPADGNSRITITAAIDPNATAGNRTITFTASSGTLFAAGIQATAGTQLATVDVNVDITGTAVVELQSTTTPMTARVQAQVKGKDLVKSVNISFTTPSADDEIQFVVSPASIPADGFSRAQLTATAKIPSDPTKRTVTFKTSTGTLFAATTGSGGTAGSLDVTTDAAGVATAQLQSTTVLDTAFVSATVNGVTRTGTVTFTSPNASDIIKLSASTTNSPADGATLVTLTATIASGLRSREVTFTVNDGKFDNGTTSMPATADSSNHASVDLKPPAQPTVVHARATVSGFSADILITYTQALPESILVSPTAASVSASATETINVSLFKAIGTPSPGLIPTFVAKDPSGNTVGTFTSVAATTTTTSPPGATTSATYNPSGTAYRGTVTISVTVGGLTGTATVTITN